MTRQGRRGPWSRFLEDRFCNADLLMLLLAAALTGATAILAVAKFQL